jgi:hypothetical protein
MIMDENKRLTSLFNVMNALQKEAMDGYRLMAKARVSAEELSGFLENELYGLVQAKGSTVYDEVGNAFLAVPVDRQGDFNLERYVLGRQLGIFTRNTRFPGPSF